MIKDSQQLKEGTIGEDIFEQWLESRGLVKDKDFFRYTYDKNPEEQKNHIDFDVKGYTIDVKWGRTVSQYGNIAVEYKQIKKYGVVLPGNWLDDCKSAYLLYGDCVYRKFYIVEVDKLRKFIADPVLFKKFVTKHQTGDGTIYNDFYAIPAAVLEGHRVIIGEICLGE